MKKYHLIVLAGGKQESLFKVSGIRGKARIPIHGKPMLEWVLDAFRQSGCVADSVVAGSRKLDELDCMRHVRKRVHGGATVLASLMNAVAYTKLRLPVSDSIHSGYIISFCDAVFLTPEIIQEMLSNIEKSQADIVLHYVSKSVFEKAGLPLTRTFIPLRCGEYTGSTVYYIRRFRDLTGVLPELADLRKLRKRPTELIRVVGCDGMDMHQTEAHISERLSRKVRVFSICHAEAGMDVDKPSDLELAIKLLAHRDKL